MKKIISLLLCLPLCATAQNYVNFANSTGTDTARTNNSLLVNQVVRFALYGSTDTTQALGVTSNGQLVLRKFALASDSTVILPTISALEAYSGPSSLVFVSDTLRGGWFHKQATGMPDSGIAFPSVAGKVWWRYYTGDVLATWYGAVGDSSTDNTIPFRLWLSSPYIKGNYARLPKGNYLVSDTINVTYQCRLNGSAGFAPYQGTVGTNPVGVYAGGSSVIIQTTDKNLFHINADGMYIDGLTIKNTFSSPSHSVALVVDSGYAFKLHDTYIEGFYDQLNIGGGSEITIGENQFVNPQRRYMNLGSYIGDEGDNLVEGNWFENIVSTDTGVYVTGCAGFRFFNNKMHIPVGQVTGNYLSCALFLQGTSSTSDMSIIGNSIEAYSGAGTVVTTDGIHTLTKLLIANNNTTNNTGGNMRNIVVYAKSANAINNVIISNNIIGNQGTIASIYLQNLNDYSIFGNSYGFPFNSLLEDTEVNCINRRSDTIMGDVNGRILTNIATKFTPLNGSITQQIYPNILAYQFASTATGATIIHTKIPRTANHMFQIHVHGTSFLSTAIDFNITGYMLSSQNGNIDGQPGSVFKQAITDNGTDGFNKYVGVDSLGYLAIAIGDTSTAQNTYAFDVDYTNLIGGSASTYTSGWFVTKSTVTNFHWLDNRTITANPPVRGIITDTGDATGSGTNTIALTIAPNKVTYSKMQMASTHTLLGNPTGATANIQEITLGTGFSFTGSTLNYAGSGVASLSNSDGTLTISPSTGAVTSSLNLSHSNTWLVTQTFNSNILTPFIPRNKQSTDSLLISSATNDSVKKAGIWQIVDTTILATKYYAGNLISTQSLQSVMGVGNSTTLEYIGTSENLSGSDTVQGHVILPNQTSSTAAGVLYTDGNGVVRNVTASGSEDQIYVYKGGKPTVTDRWPVNSITSNYTATDVDNMLLADCGSNSVIVTLPSTGITTGHPFIVKMINTSSGHTCTITSPTTIDGHVGDTVLTLTNEAITLKYDGAKYEIVSFYNPSMPVYGTSTQSGDGTTTTFTIAHGLGVTPTWFNAVPTSSAAANIAYITADATNITVHYTVAPVLGTNNLIYNFEAKP